MKNTIELAVDSIAGFETIRYKLERSLINNGKSRRTYQAYAHYIASRCLHFNRLPFDITDEQIVDYLFQINAQQRYSETYFKFIVYGLRSGKGNKDRYVVSQTVFPPFFSSNSIEKKSSLTKPVSATGASVCHFC